MLVIVSSYPSARVNRASKKPATECAKFDTVNVAPIAIDEPGQGGEAVAGAEPDHERAAVVEELRFAIAVPDDDQPRALVDSFRVRHITPDAGPRR
jgi:hypothetical protein